MDPAPVRINLLGTSVDCIGFEESSRRIDEFVRGRVPRQIVTANLDFLRLARRDRKFQAIINSSSMVVPDGMPLIWASRLLGLPIPERVAGVDLVVECSRLAAEQGYRVFFLGAAPGVADKAAGILKGRFPGLQVVGTHSPSSLSEDEDRISLSLIKASRPDILFVAFGAPRQDRWIHKYLEVLDVPVCMGVGGSFDMLSGRISRAPGWMQRSGMEWFFRFISEPRRLWQRYFVHDLPTFARLMVSAGVTDHVSLVESVPGYLLMKEQALARELQGQPDPVVA